MPLILYNGKILTRGGYLASSIDCCCDKKCPVGQLAVWAYYFTDIHQVEVGVDENTYINEVLSEFSGTHYGYKLSVAFWVGNPEAAADPVTGKIYYGEFQIWLVAVCCPKDNCDDFLYQDKAEQFALDWTRITDPSSQFEWDPTWAVGSCAGNTIESDAGIDVLFECVRQAISFPNDPATGQFALKQSIEICCEG